MNKPPPPSPEEIAKVEKLGADTELSKAKAAEILATLPSSIMRNQADADYQAAMAFTAQPNLQTPPDMTGNPQV